MLAQIRLLDKEDEIQRGRQRAGAALSPLSPPLWLPTPSLSVDSLGSEFASWEKEEVGGVDHGSPPAHSPHSPPSAS